MGLPSDEYLTLGRRLRRDVATYEAVSVRLPQQPLCDLADGLVWLVEMASEGWYLDYKVEATADGATVWVKRWEFGEAEPAWEEVRGQQVQDTRADVPAWEADATYRRSRDEARRAVMDATAP
jgi:hypothetical protein